MIQGRHWLRCALLVLLALAVLGSGSLAAGDFFDDDYADCPHKTRLRDGQIADLTLARDAEEETEVNVSWAATDPATWGLGPNAYSASLVVILDDNDGDPVAKTLSLGSRKTTFERVATGKEVTVQMAIVVDTAEGDYLISDILEATVNQSLTAPAFSTEWLLSNFNPAWVDLYRAIPLPELGRMYYLGYNANFGNYRAGKGLTFTTEPATPRFRIGLVHGGENDDAREDVKFDAYVIRLLGEDGDIVPEGDDVRTVVSDYGQSFVSGSGPDFVPGNYDNHLVLPLSLVEVYGGPNVSFRRLVVGTDVRVTSAQAAQNRASLVAAGPLFNVRINDGGAITPPMYQSEIVRAVIAADAAYYYSPAGRIAALSIKLPNDNEVFAPAPDAHRDFPIDVLASDRTYTIEAWAVNEDREVISPKATLKVHPRAQAPTTLTTGDGSFWDYHLTFGTAVTSGTLLTTEFTVLK